MASRFPYYRKNRPSTKNEASFRADGQLIDLAAAHLDENSGTRTQDAQRHFDDRAAAAIRASSAIDRAGDKGPPRVWPVVAWVNDLGAGNIQLHPQNSDGPLFDSKELLEMKWYKENAHDSPPARKNSCSARLWRLFP